MARRLESILYRRINSVVAAIVAVTLVMLLSMALVAILFAAHMRRQQDEYNARLADLSEQIAELRDDLSAYQRLADRESAAATRPVQPTTRSAPPVATTRAAVKLLTAAEIDLLGRWLAAGKVGGDPKGDLAAGRVLDRGLVRLAELDAAGASVDRDLLVLLAKANLVRGDVAAALVLLRRAAGDGPKSVEMHSLLAAAHMLAGRSGRAEVEFRSALKLEPDSLDLRLQLAAVLLDGGKRDEAIVVLAAADNNALDAGEKLRLARMRAAAGDDRGAAALFAQLAAASPRDSAAWRGFGDAALRMKDYAGAADALRRAAEAGDDSAQLQYNWGLALLGAKRPAEAETRLARAAKLKPAWADAWWALGVVMAQQEKHTRAVDAFQNCLSANADHPNAWLNLAMSLVAVGKIQEAVENLEEDLAVHTGSAEGHLLLARLYAQQQKVRDVARTLEIALRLNPKLRIDAAGSVVFTDLKDPRVRSLLFPDGATRPTTRTGAP